MVPKQTNAQRCSYLLSYKCLLLSVCRDNQVLGKKSVQDGFVNEVATEPSMLQVVPEVSIVFIQVAIVCHIVSPGTTSLQSNNIFAGAWYPPVKKVSYIITVMLLCMGLLVFAWRPWHEMVQWTAKAVNQGKECSAMPANRFINKWTVWNW